jgi:hypothetical protein
MIFSHSDDEESLEDVIVVFGLSEEHIDMLRWWQANRDVGRHSDGDAVC